MAKIITTTALPCDKDATSLLKDIVKNMHYYDLDVITGCETFISESSKVIANAKSKVAVRTA